MQFTLIAVQNNGQQMVMGQDMQEHSVASMLRGAVESSNTSQVRKESKYRSFVAVGTNEHATEIRRYDAQGQALARQVGLV